MGHAFSMQQAYSYVISNGGIATNEDYPFVGFESSQPPYPQGLSTDPCNTTLEKKVMRCGI
jgi:hypothetical protein